MKSLFLLACMVALWLYGVNSISAQTTEKSYRGDLLLRKGDSIFLLERWSEAISIYQRSQQRALRQDEWEAYLYSTNQIAECHLQMKDSSYQEIFDNIWQESMPHFTLDSGLVAQKLYVIGLYAALRSNLLAAEEHLYEATKIWQKDLPNSARRLSSAFLSLARVYEGLNDLLTSANYFEKAVTLHREYFPMESERLARIFVEIGANFRSAGETFRAQNNLKHAEIFYRQNPMKYLDKFTNCLLLLGNVSFDSDEFNSAKDYYQEALFFLEKKPSLLGRKITVLANMGSVYSYLGYPDSAEVYFSRAISANHQKSQVDLRKLVETYTQYADHHYQSGDPAAAIHLFRSSLKTASELEKPDLWEISLIWRKLAEISAVMHLHRDSAKIYLHRSIEAHPLIALTDLENLPESDLLNKVDDLYEFVRIKAIILHGKYQETRRLVYLEQSLQSHKYLGQIINVIRNGPFSDITRRKISRIYRSSANDALACIMEVRQTQTNSEQIEFALSLMEKTRHSELFSKMMRAQKKHMGLLPDSVYQKEKKILSVVNARHTAVIGESESGGVIPQTQSLIEARQDMQRYRAEMASKYPAYYQVKYDDLLTIHEFQARLEKRQQIFEYFWGDSILTLAAITKTSANLEFIPITDSLTNWLSWTLQFISAGSEKKTISDYHKYFNVSYNLYREIIEPFIKPSSEHLIISPDGDLSFLPFDILITNNKERNLRMAAYLLRDYSTQYTYSTNLLFKNPAQTNSKDISILAFAYSDHETNKLPPLKGLRELPASLDEIKMIEEVYGRKKTLLFHGQNATESAFRVNAVNSNIIHLALHGISDTVNDARSHLIFRDGPETPEDGILYNYEIYNQDLMKNRLAVLSTCQSGLGTHIEGEGIFSVARAFMQTGIPTVIMSLWNANDESTSLIMARLHHHIARGISVDKALQKAKIDYLNQADLEQYCEPYFWSTFIVLGDTSPIITKSNLHLILFVLIVLAIMLWWGTKHLSKRVT